jgi:hypothetical protein
MSGILQEEILSILVSLMILRWGEESKSGADFGVF